MLPPARCLPDSLGRRLSALTWQGLLGHVQAWLPFEQTHPLAGHTCLDGGSVRDENIKNGLLLSTLGTGAFRHLSRPRSLPHPSPPQAGPAWSFCNPGLSNPFLFLFLL